MKTTILALMLALAACGGADPVATVDADLGRDDAGRNACPASAMVTSTCSATCGTCEDPGVMIYTGCHVGAVVCVYGCSDCGR